MCEKWRRVPWHASIEIDENTSFKCADQVSWGVVPDEASCDVPEPSFGEDDVVFDCSALPDSSIVEGAKVGARVASKISRRVQTRKINHPRPRLMGTSRVDGVNARCPRRSTRAAGKPVVGSTLESFPSRGSTGKPYVWACTSWAGTRNLMKCTSCRATPRNSLLIEHLVLIIRRRNGSRAGKRPCPRSRRSGRGRPV